jgi:hypothetical protein
VHDMMERHQTNLDLCAKVEADLADRAPLAEYRTQAGARRPTSGLRGHPGLGAR